jgi:hypothetical protein
LSRLLYFRDLLFFFLIFSRFILFFYLISPNLILSFLTLLCFISLQSNLLLVGLCIVSTFIHLITAFGKWTSHSLLHIFLTFFLLFPIYNTSFLLVARFYWVKFIFNTHTRRWFILLLRFSISYYCKGKSISFKFKIFLKYIN